MQIRIDKKLCVMFIDFSNNYSNVYPKFWDMSSLRPDPSNYLAENVNYAADINFTSRVISDGTVVQIPSTIYIGAVDQTFTNIRY